MTASADASDWRLGRFDLLVGAVLVGGDRSEEHERRVFRNADSVLDATLREHELPRADISLGLISDGE